MQPVPNGEVTAILRAWRGGDASAVDRLMPLVYDELRSVAQRHLGRERSSHTLQPTGLVHETYLRLVGKDHPQWEDRVHFFGVAAELMRRVLVDHARAHCASKRGGGASKLQLDEARVSVDARPAELLRLDEALTELAATDARKARIIELRYFGGMTLEETAMLIGLSTATVNNESRFARAWLQRRMDRN